MAVVFPNEAEVMILKMLLNVEATENLIIRLFVNNYTPTETDSLASYTEASGFGYNSVTFIPGSWIVSAGNPSEGDYPEIEWTFTGNLGLVYGYFVTGQTSNTVYWSERFSNGPYNVQNNGDQIRITPTITLS